MIRITLPLALAAALAACGGPDPTPKADGSASASEINAAVAEAQNTAVDAKMNVEGHPNTPEEREKVAKDVLGEANTVAGTASGGNEGSAAARQGRPTTVAPSAGDPLTARPQ